MKNILLFTAFICLCAGCQDQAETTALKTEVSNLKNLVSELEAKVIKAENAPTGFVHAVYFWMEEGVTEEEFADFKKGCAELLGPIKTVNRIHLGGPAGTPREVVDNSYDYAAIVEFVDKAGHDAYQVDPLHDQFREKYGKMFKRVQIYDSLVE